MRRNKNDPIKIVLITAAVFFLCTTVFFAFKYVGVWQESKKGATAADVAAVQKEKALLEEKLLQAADMLAQLEEQLAATELELQKNLDASSTHSAQQQARIDNLRGDKVTLEEEIQIQKEKILALEKAAETDFQAHSNLLSDLYKMLTQGAPLRRIKAEETEENTAETSPLDTESQVLTKEDWLEAYPHISLYYEDLTTGYSVSYNATDVRYTASLIKAPYIYAILREIEAFEENKYQFSEDGKPLYDEEGIPLFEGQHPNLDDEGKIKYKEGEEKYDLSQIWTYDPETMFKEGSGEIRYKEAGFQLTWKELVEYALLFSDNIAFAQLRERFGMSSYYALAGELKLKAVYYSFMQLSAEECGAFLRKLYTWFQTESEMALWMQDCMRRSSHTVLISSAVGPTACAHKYGWDKSAYHDMGIVYNEHPYLIVIMTDLDQGGSEVDTYIRSVIRQCQKIHNHLYQK